MVTTRGRYKAETSAPEATAVTVAKKHERDTEETSVLNPKKVENKKKKTTTSVTTGRGKMGKSSGKKTTGDREDEPSKEKHDVEHSEKESGQPTNGIEDSMPKNDDQKEDAGLEKKQDGEDTPQKNGNQNRKEEVDTLMPDASAVHLDRSREKEVNDSPIFEKGLVYFFLRGKVNVEHPESMDEIKKAYMVVRPLPAGTKLVDGKVGDSGNNRLITIPKKKLPSKGYERFLTFVEEPAASLEVLRERYLKGRTYQTKTVGERTDFPAYPVGEGVYAITKSKVERQSHFAYILTLPKEPNELQQEFGLRERGSFIVSVKNPSTPALPDVGVPDPAEYPNEIMEEFGGLRWGPLHPKHLDYKNAEVLFICEKGFPEGGEHEGTADELHQLEEEDEKRVEHLQEANSIFADLELSRKDFQELQTTWG